MKKSLLFVLTLILALPVSVSMGSSFPEDKVKSHMKELSQRGLNRAIVVGIINPDGKRYFFEGTFREGDTRRVNARTIFEISSLTQFFTGLLATQAAENDDIDLDAPASTYLPEEIVLPTFEETEITLDTLIEHTSGLPRLPPNLDPSVKQNPYVDYTWESMGEFLGEYELPQKPGSKFVISRAGYGLVGLALERQSGETFEAMVKSRICDPLEMKNTSISLNEVQRYNLARGHQGETQSSLWEMPVFAGSGALRSDAKDMLQFLGANLGLIESPLLPIMEKTHEVLLKSEKNNMAVATGWVVYRNDDADIHYRSGLTGGHASFAGFRKDTRTGVVVLSNSASSVEKLGMYLLDHEHFKLREFIPVIEVSNTDLRQYAGVFQLPNGLRILFHLQEGHLTTQFEQSARYRVQPIKENTFYHPKMRIELVFQRNPKGFIDKVSFNQGEETLTATRVRI